MRLPAAQALVRWLLAQRGELLDGTQVPLFAAAQADVVQHPLTPSPT